MHEYLEHSYIRNNWDLLMNTPIKIKKNQSNCLLSVCKEGQCEMGEGQ